MKNEPMDYAAKQAERKRLLEQAASNPGALNPGFSPAPAAPPASATPVATSTSPTEAMSRTQSPTPPVARARGPIGQWHRQGISLYPSDDDIVRKIDRLLNQRKIRLGVNPGPSLYARAGLRLLDDIVTRDPDRALDMLRTMAQTRR